MTVPSKKDIRDRQAKLDKMLKGLEADGSMSEKKLCTQMRSAVRQTWMRHSVKISYLMKQSYPDMNPNTRTKWLVDCECCGEAFKTSDVQIDHKQGEHSLLTLEDILPFAQSILGVSHDDLQVVCIPCHEAITYAERYGMSLEDAFKEKAVIAKLKQTVTRQKTELKNAGFAAKDISNETKRRECYRQLLKGEN